MLRNPRLTLGAVIAALAFTPALAAGPLGVFVRPSTGTQVDFYDCAGKLCGKIVAVKDPSRSKEIGTLILKDAAKVGENLWKGSLFDPDSGKTYASVVQLDGADGLNLKGCVMGGLICKGETWRSVR